MNFLIIAEDAAFCACFTKRAEGSSRSSRQHLGVMGCCHSPWHWLPTLLIRAMWLPQRLGEMGLYSCLLQTGWHGHSCESGQHPFYRVKSYPCEINGIFAIDTDRARVYSQQFFIVIWDGQAGITGNVEKNPSTCTSLFLLGPVFHCFEYGVLFFTVPKAWQPGN